MGATPDDTKLSLSDDKGMESESGLELAARVDQLEERLGLRVALLERRVALLEPPTVTETTEWRPPADVAPPPNPLPPSGAVTPDIGTSESATPTAAMPPPPTGKPLSIAVPAAARTGPTFAVGVEALLRWAGIGLVVLAALFLVSTAIERGWIGPQLQLAAATALGFALIGGAFRLVAERRTYALALANGGAAVIVICAGAAHIWLGLYSALAGLVTVSYTHLTLPTTPYV